MRQLQLYIPEPRHIETFRVFVNATPEKAWQAARHFDAGQIPWIRFLFDLRTLPDRITGKAVAPAPAPTNEDRRIGVDEIADSETGFKILHEEPGHEVIIGSIGQFWNLHIPFIMVSNDKFREFNAPGWGKLAWAITVEPYKQGSTISFELRITATDETTWQTFNRYYNVIGIGSKLIRYSVMTQLETLLGKLPRPDFSTMALPGDERIPNAKYFATQQTDIEAPAEIVWRYLMQLGCDRAGWYSIDLLDNGGKPSVNHLVDEWSTRNVGERLATTPALDSFFDVYEVVPEKSFVLGGNSERLGNPYKVSWAFVLEPIGDDACILIARARMETSPDWKEWLVGRVLVGPVHLLMQGVQLNNIKKLAERDSLLRKPDQPIISQKLHDAGNLLVNAMSTLYNAATRVSKAVSNN